MFCQPHCVTSELSERDRQPATATEAFIWSLLTAAMVRWTHSQITAWVCFASCSLTRPAKSQLTWAWVPWWAPWGSVPAPAAPWCAPPAGLESPLWSPAACQTTAHTDITVRVFITCSLPNQLHTWTSLSVFLLPAACQTIAHTDITVRVFITCSVPNNCTHRHHCQSFYYLQLAKQLHTQTSLSVFLLPAACQTIAHTDITVSLFITCICQTTYRHTRWSLGSLQLAKQLHTQTSPSVFSSPAACQTTEHTHI